VVRHGGDQPAVRAPARPSWLPVRTARFGARRRRHRPVGPTRPGVAARQRSTRTATPVAVGGGLVAFRRDLTPPAGTSVPSRRRARSHEGSPSLCVRDAGRLRATSLLGGAVRSTPRQTPSGARLPSCAPTSLVRRTTRVPRGGERSPREHRATRSRQRRRAATDSIADQGPEVGGTPEACRARACTDAEQRKANRTARGKRPTVTHPTARPRGGNATEARWNGAVTRYGCGRGESSEGYGRCGKGYGDGWETGRAPDPETQRTPWPAAGCNKPAGRLVEQAAEAARNSTSGTSEEHGRLRAEGSHLPREAEVGSGHQALRTAEGQSLDNPRRGVPARAGAEVGSRPRPRTSAEWDRTRRKRVFEGE